MRSNPISVLFVLTSHDQLGDTGRSTGWFMPEAAHPWRIFKDAGYTVAFASPGGGRPSMYGHDENDPIQQEFLAVFGSAGPDTVMVSSMDASKFDVVFFVGGHGTMWDFADDVDLIKLTSSVYEAGGIVAAVCHGPAALVNVRLDNGSYLVAGKKLAAFTNAEEESMGLGDVIPFWLAPTLIERGASHVEAPDFEANVVVDGRLVTGQNPASATGVGIAVVEAAAAL